MYRFIFAVVLILSGFSASAQQPIAIIPEPLTMKMLEQDKPFSLSASTDLVLEGRGLESTAAYLNEYLKKYYSFQLKTGRSAAKENVVRLQVEASAANNNPAYMLISDKDGIMIQGNSARAVFYGVQTLIQLLPVTNLTKKPSAGIPVPQVSIEDVAGFNYRGMHLDVARHFFPVQAVKRYIDFLALHKFNTFHWHLTDDQGWRIEIKKYPELTTVGSVRNGSIIGRYPGTGNDKLEHKGFYTQDEIREVVQYAADRFIDVIPEIEMPGHASAAIAAFPQLSCFPDEPTFPNYYPKECAWNGSTQGKQVQQTWGVFDDVFCAGKDSTFAFLQNVLEEVLQLFPGKYIHVGGDECPKENWKRCALCQKRMQAEGLKDEHELQSYFIQRIEKFLNQKGRVLIGWDEILEGGLAPNAVVMSWRGETGGIAAAKEGHQVIMTPGNPVYFDHTQSENEDSVTIGGYNPLEKVYAYDPIPGKLESEAERNRIMGAQANLWTEYITNPGKIEYMIFPRMSALSEVLWSAKENRNWNNFEMKMPVLIQRYKFWHVQYSTAYFDLRDQVVPGADGTGINWKLEAKRPGTAITVEKIKPAGGVGTYTAPVPVTGSAVMEAWSADNAAKKLRREFFVNKLTGQRIGLAKPASSSYPGDGAFTLVNGIQNTKGTARAKEFLGFSGSDCEATITWKEETTFNTVVVHSLDQRGSWIWKPASVDVYVQQADGSFKLAGSANNFISNQPGARNGTITVQVPGTKTRGLRIVVHNNGTIPSGNPGAGNPAWLFVDEVEARD